jgi:hypothetical protein
MKGAAMTAASIWTLPELEAKISDLKKALSAAMLSQEYTTSDGMKVTRASLPDIQSGLQYFETEKAKLMAITRPRILQGRPAR